MAARTGVNGGEFNACLSDQALADRILAERSEGSDIDGAGGMQNVLRGPNNRDFLRAQFSAHIARHTAA